MDWREGCSSMTYLISRLPSLNSSESYTDVTFRLPDGGTVTGHKLILAIASPFFEAKFYSGRWGNHHDTVEITHVDSLAFRRLLNFIYNSGPLDWDMETREYWDLLEVAHLYMVPGLIEHCNEMLCDEIVLIEDVETLIARVNEANKLYIHGVIAKAGMIALRDKMKETMESKSWWTLQKDTVLFLVSDKNLKVTEGELFTGMVKWCRGNTDTETEAIEMFQNIFADRIFIENISETEFIKKFEPLEEFLPHGLFRRCTFETIKNKCKKGTRFALNPYKAIEKILEREDFLNARSRPGVQGDGHGLDTVIWRTTDEFADVNIDIKIYQKISEGIHAPQGRFGILLDTSHTSKDGADKSCIIERVSIKMVGVKADGTVVKKLFKPIEDSTRESDDSRTNIFVLSKSVAERKTWNLMKIGVIIDRRPKCHIKGISGEKFAITVSSAPTMKYLEKAQSFSFDIGLSLADCMIDMAERLNVRDLDHNTSAELTWWLYIFTRGFVSTLRSKRALPNDFFTAETVEDFQRCKVINFPIGASKVEKRRDAFRTWIVSKVEGERETGKKNLFVVKYNPLSQTVTFAKNMWIDVDETKTKMEHLGLCESIELGRVYVDQEFLRSVLRDTEAGPGSRVFIRRIFPIQDERDASMKDILVTEATLGRTLSHIDDCHVLVIQEPGDGLDYDKFILSKIREINVQFKSCDYNGQSLVELSLDPELSYREVLRRLGAHLGVETNTLELFKCYSSKSMDRRPAKIPAEAWRETSVERLLESCFVEPKTIFFRLKSDSDVHLQESDGNSSSDGMDC